MAKPQYQMSQPKRYKLIVEKDVRIPMRDGTVLYGDIFRPDFGKGNTEKFPVIFTIGPYMKDKLWVPPPDLEEKPNPYMNWETVNPLWWCPRGYALLRVDTRGSGKSPGKSEPSSYAEAVDAYDCIEWIAKRRWCNGNVGTCGISYHAAFQWRVAGLQPPSLKAIMPWEGRADQYPRPGLSRRDLRHGLHRALVQQQRRAAPARRAALLQPGRLRQQSALELHGEGPRLGILAR